MPGKISTKELFARAEANSEELLREVSNFRRNVISQFSILCQTNNPSNSALSLQSISVSVFTRILSVCVFICPPPWPEAKKKSFAKQMNFFPGVGMIFFDPVSNFQCATPRGLIRLLTVGGNLPQIALLVEAILRRVARSLPHSVLYQRKALGATFAMVHPAFSISRIFKPYFCIS